MLEGGRPSKPLYSDRPKKYIGSANFLQTIHRGAHGGCNVLGVAPQPRLWRRCNRHAVGNCGWRGARGLGSTKKLTIAMERV